MFMSLLSNDFDEAAEQREIQYARFAERWRKAWYIELDSGTICDGFIGYLKSQEETFADIEEIFGIVEELFIHSMTVRFREAILRWYLKEMPANILWILSSKEEFIFVNPSPLYPAFVEQMRQYYSEFLEWQKSKKS
jgi:hypothetical protein